jgi:hypothetical protein
LDVRQSRPEAAEHIGIWRYAKPDAVNYTLKALVRARQDIDIGSHARMDVTKLPFSKIRQDPPCTCID